MPNRGPGKKNVFPGNFRRAIGGGRSRRREGCQSEFVRKKPSKRHAEQFWRKIRRKSGGESGGKFRRKIRRNLAENPAGNPAGISGGVFLDTFPEVFLGNPAVLFPNSLFLHKSLHNVIVTYIPESHFLARVRSWLYSSVPSMAAAKGAARKADAVKGKQASEATDKHATCNSGGC